MINNYVILFAWETGKFTGGMNDSCGTFNTAEAALDFFDHATHCENMNFYQIYDIEQRTVIWEGNRGSRISER